MILEFLLGISLGINLFTLPISIICLFLIEKHRKIEHKNIFKNEWREKEPHKFYIGKDRMIDLTLMFGKGNEPTQEEFEKMMLDSFVKEYNNESNTNEH